MILLADSGSTKTDWGLEENGKLVKRLRTSGMNPFQMSEETITEEIKTHLVPELPGTVLDEVHFYGAGCTKEKQPIVERALRANLTINDECEVASDMLGAARGICGHKPGIACTAYAPRQRKSAARRKRKSSSSRSPSPSSRLSPAPAPSL